MDFGVANNDLFFLAKDTKKEFFGEILDILSGFNIFAVFHRFFALFIDRIEADVGGHVPRVDLSDKDLEISQFDS